VPAPSGFVVVAGDVIVGALVLAVVFALGLLLWVTWRLTVRAVSRIRPAKPRPVRVVAELGPDGKDSGRTRIGG
jgi:hypothetical protein